MLIAWVMIVPANNSDGIGDMGPRGGDCIQTASDHRLVYVWIAGFLGGLSLVKLHHHRCGNCPGLVHSEFRQDRPNVAVLMDVNRVILPIAFNVHVEIPTDIPNIMHPQPLLHLVLGLPNLALNSNHMEIIDVQSDCGNDYVVVLNH
jgi:hypothetical protein